VIPVLLPIAECLDFLRVGGFVQKTFTSLGKHSEALFEHRQTDVQRREEADTDYEEKDIGQFWGQAIDDEENRYGDYVKTGADNDRTPS
jgi:hypothetical protein